MNNFEENYNNPEVQKEKSINFRRILIIIAARWYVPVIVISLAMVFAYLQLRYTKPIYSASASIKFDESKGVELNDVFRYGKLNGRIENMLRTEEEVIGSRSMALKTLERMKMYFSIYFKGDIVSARIYPNEFFKCKPIFIDSADLGNSITISFNKNGRIELLKGKNKKTGIFFKPTDTISIGNSKIFIEPNLSVLYRIEGQPVVIVINDLMNDADLYGYKIKTKIEKGTNIMTLNFLAEGPELARDYVNALAETYIQETINKKTMAAEQTINYIDSELVDLASKVSKAQKELSGFKSNNRVLIDEEAVRIALTSLVKLETEKGIAELRKKQIELLEKNLMKSKNKMLEMVVFDLEDAEILSVLYRSLNDLIMERIATSSKHKPNSPKMLENERKINELKSAIARVLSDIKQNVQNIIKQNEAEIKVIDDDLQTMPEREQALLNLQRNFKINERMYGYLQEKKLENLISRSAVTSNVSIIDKALIKHRPVFPKPQDYYVLALLIGLAISILIILTDRAINNKIPDKESIEAISFTPVIGIIQELTAALSDKEYKIHLLNKPKSVFAESLRGIRTNMNFILKGEKNKFICVTSTVSGEGKTFCTINLAASLTLLDYKVLVVGCDLRRPKIHLSFKNIDNNSGLSTFLINKHELSEVIKETEHPNFYVLPAGPVPPNPAELLQSSKFNQFLEIARKEFDYVFFDTAPVGLVTDALALMAVADINLFIIRAQYSKRDFALIPDKLANENSLKNMYFILNSFDATSSAYSSIYRTTYGGNYYGGSYYYYSGYSSRRSNGYYGKRYHKKYFSEYYSEDEMLRNKKFKNKLLNFLKKIKLIG